MRRSGPGLIDLARGLHLYVWLPPPAREESELKVTGKTIKLRRRERWLKYVVDGGDAIVQRSNKQRNDQDDREREAATPGFYVLPST